MTIKKYRNRYFLITPVKYMIKNALNEDELKRI